MNRYYIAFFKGETDPGMFGINASADPEADDQGALELAKAFGEEEYKKPLVRLLKVTTTKEISIF